MSALDKTTGGPAFPYAFQHEDSSHYTSQGFAPGMSLRDWFAGQAITAASQAWLSANDQQRMALSGCVDARIIFQRDFPRFIERVSGEIADAMLAARTKGAAS